MSQQGKEGAEVSGRTGGCAGWKTTAIGLLTAVVIGVIMIAIGAAKVRQGAQLQKQAELRMKDMLAYLADDARNESALVAADLTNENWGKATQPLGRLTAAVSMMDQVAPPAARQQVEEVKRALAQVQEAVGSRSSDWPEKLKAFNTALEPLVSPQE